VLTHLSSHSPKPTPQAAAGVTYAEKITKEDRILDCSLSAAQLLNQIRGLSPSPAATAEIGGEIVKIFRAGIEENAAEKLEITNNNQLIKKCGDGRFLRIEELQRPGKLRQTAEQFLQRFNVYE